LFINLSSKCG